MQFNSLHYGALLVVTWLLFAVVSGRLRIGVLIGASFVFYASWNVPLVSLIVISALTDYGVSLQLAKTSNAGRRRLLLCISIAVNLSSRQFENEELVSMADMIDGKPLVLAVSSCS